MLLDYSSAFRKAREKLARKNPVLLSAIEKKIWHIATYPSHYKPLRYDHKGLRRVHFGSYVLIYRLRRDTVELVTIDHHDDAYHRSGTRKA